MKKQILILTTAILSLTAFAQVPNYVPTNGLVGYWPFNGNANDESGNGNNGTVNGATLTNDRCLNPNSAYNFDGLDDYILFNLNSISNSFPASSATTTSVWVKTADLNGPIISMSGVGGYEYLLHVGTLADIVQSSGNYGMLVRDNCCGTGNNIFGGNVTNNDWHMITVVRSSNGTLNLYKDGILDIISSASQSGALNFSTTTMAFGADLSWVIVSQSGGCGACNSVDQQHLNGKIDDIGIWNRALNSQEILTLFSAQLTTVSVFAGSDQTICNGEQVILSATNSQNYGWNNGVVDGVPFSPTNTQNYIVTADSAGCQSADTLTVFVNQPSNSTLNETALDSYTLNGQTYTESGTYTQVIPNAAGCDSTITLNLSLNFTGIQELENSFAISPNPATDELTITTNALLNENYFLFDPQGRKVLSGPLTGLTTLLNITQLARGNYLLQIGQKQLPVKLIKQ
jgi:hypothetical protein